MKDTTKTIIIGSVITILVLVLTIFILYKTSTKKVNIETSSNKTEYNNSTPTTNLNNNEDSNSNNTPIENNTSTTPIDDNETNSKVILYLFHGATCPACNNAIKTIKEERNTTFKNVEIRTYEIWGNKDNSQLLSNVTSKLNVTAKYIPYFIVGDYSKDGFNSETLLEEYKKALNNKNYKDIVQETIKENPNLNPVYETI